MKEEKDFYTELATNEGDASDNDNVSNINLTWSSKYNLSPLRICNDDSFSNIDGNKSAHVRLITPSKQIQLVWQFYISNRFLWF